MRRVAVTGLGIVSPIGNNLRNAWSAAMEGRSGISAITDADFQDCPVRIGGVVQNFDATDYMNEKEARRCQRFVHLAVAAAKMALQDADFAVTEENANNVGVTIGVGVGALGYIEENILLMDKKGPRGVSPFTIPGFIANMASGIVSIETRAKGPNSCTTTACASGTHALGDAMMMIQTGKAQVMIAGGAESAMSKFAFASFARMKALCADSNENPQQASRPFDVSRSGFVMGEGAGVLVLEDLEHARARGARIYCELKGFGMSSDAFHMTAPAEGGEGAFRAMRQALETGGINLDEVDHINAHGTSTPANDKNEAMAINALFGERAQNILVTSTKSMTGHLLGAAGGVEAVFSVMAMQDGIVPPTLNLQTVDPEVHLNIVRGSAQKKKIRVALSNSFGFGGTNAVVAFKSLD